MGRPAISEYETLKREAHPSTATRLADALEVDVEDLRYRQDVEHPGWGKQYGNILKAAREAGGYGEEVKLLRRFAEEAEPGPGKSIHQAQASEVAFVQALVEMDLAEVPGRAARLIRAYVQLAGSFVAAGVAIPAGLARSLVEALERVSDDEKGEDDGPR